jgi:hypothetical protein
MSEGLRGLPELLAIIQADYREMPRLTLTPRQAQRLWHADAATCECALAALVNSGFLTRSAIGTYLAAPRTLAQPA